MSRLRTGSGEFNGSIRSRGNGRRQIIDFLLPGDFIGLDNLTLVDSGISVETLTDAALCVFDRGEMIDAVQAHPALKLAMARMTLQTDAAWAEQGRKTAVEGAGSLLLKLFKRQ